MKKILATTMTLLALVAAAAVVRDAHSARAISYLKSESPSVTDYVLEGLVAMWDGEFNAVDADGNLIHDPDVTKHEWLELMGTGWYIDSTLDRGGFWGVNYYGQTSTGSGLSGCSAGLRQLLSNTHTAEYIYGDCFFYDSSISGAEALGGTFGGGINRNVLYCTSPQLRVYNDAGWSTYTTVDKPLRIIVRYDMENLVQYTDLFVGSTHLQYNSAITRTTSVTYFYFQPWMHKAHCLRFYNRLLSDDEMNHNGKIDKARFGL